MNVNVLPGGIIKGKIQASMKKKVYQVEVSELANELGLARNVGHSGF